VLGSLPRILLTVLVEQATPAAKAKLPPRKVRHSKPNKLVAHTRVDSRAPRVMFGATNTKRKPFARPRGHIQVLLKQEKENVPIISDSGDETDDPLQAIAAAPAPEEDATEEQEQETHLYNTSTLPNPFLDTDEEDGDPAGGKWPERRGARAEEEPDSDRESVKGETLPSFPAVEGPLGVPGRVALKSCLHAPGAPKKDCHITWKDRLAQYYCHFHGHPDDTWSRMGLKDPPLRPLKAS
jgi:hypothetical protein